MSDLQLIPASAVRLALGGISDMSLWRWINDDDLDFPRPVVINRRRYWREADIATWLETRSQEAA